MKSVIKLFAARISQMVMRMSSVINVCRQLLPVAFVPRPVRKKSVKFPANDKAFFCLSQTVTCRQYSFCHSTRQLWNSIPDYITENAKSVNEFESSRKSFF